MTSSGPGHADGREALEINVIAPAQIASLAVDGMERRKRGHIVDAGSTGGESRRD